MDFFNPSSRDFFLTIINDFTCNNHELIELRNLGKVLAYFKKVGCFFTKFMEFFDEFSSINSFDKTSICFATTTEFMIKENQIKLTKGQFDFLKNWTIFVIEGNNTNQDLVLKYTDILLKMYQEMAYSESKLKIFKYAQLEL